MFSTRLSVSRKLFLIGLTALIPAQVWAWGNLGHETVGEIAERLLDAKGKAMVLDILGAEPLAVAAIFPDLVRPDNRFDPFKPYHFFEIPDGKTAAQAIEAARGKPNADTIISKSGSRLTNRDLSRAKKAFLLRYLVHLVGDVHQPLHVGNGQDMGANLCYVTFTEPDGHHSNSNLHSVWDDNVLNYAKFDYFHDPKNTGKKYFDHPQYADRLMNDPANNTPQAKAALLAAAKQPAVDWYTESRALHPQVYPDTLKPSERTYCSLFINEKFLNGAHDKTKPVPILDQAYGRKAAVLAGSQILKAGYRLAYTLNQLANDGTWDRPEGADTIQKFLQSSHLETEDQH